MLRWGVARTRPETPDDGHDPDPTRGSPRPPPRSSMSDPMRPRCRPPDIRPPRCRRSRRRRPGPRCRKCRCSDPTGPGHAAARRSRPAACRRPAERPAGADEGDRRPGRAGADPLRRLGAEGPGQRLLTPAGNPGGRPSRSGTGAGTALCVPPGRPTRDCGGPAGPPAAPVSAIRSRDSGQAADKAGGRPAAFGSHVPVLFQTARKPGSVGGGHTGVIERRRHVPQPLQQRRMAAAGGLFQPHPIGHRHPAAAVPDQPLVGQAGRSPGSRWCAGRPASRPAIPG